MISPFIWGSLATELRASSSCTPVASGVDFCDTKLYKRSPELLEDENSSTGLEKKHELIPIISLFVIN